MELLCIRWFFVLNRHCKNLIMAVGFTIVAVLCITLILILKENEYNAEALTSNTTSNSTSIVTLGNKTAGGDLIVIDTDAGVDDAVAILALLSDPKLGQSVVGITCVRGNTEVKNVAKNVLKILKIANRMEIPVYVGSSKNLLENPDHGDYFGKDGMGDANYPEEQPRSMLHKEQASIFLSSVVNKYPGKVTVVVLGPMTNIALATRLNSNFMKQVKKMVALGGVLKGGTMRPGVEFNIFMDPHAASLVMEELSLAGKKMTMLPSDTVKANLIDKAWRTSKLGTIKSKKIYFMNKIEAHELNKTSLYWEPFDFYVSVILMRPEVITNKNSYYAQVETEGKFAKGTVIFDYSNLLNKTNNVEVILSVDKKVVKSISLEYLP